jgi:hypothetical protein
MAHPAAELINVYNGAEGVKQAPAFLRTAAAAEEMEDLIINLQGRPIPRKGYTLVNTDTLSIGTDADEYTTDEQLVVAHWLGDEDTPNGITRLYYFPRDASWVQDEIGRLLYLVGRGQDPKIIDIKDNIAYDWVTTAPIAGTDDAFSMEIVNQDEINVNKDLLAIEADKSEIASFNVFQPDRSIKEAYIDIRAITDITSASLEVRDADGDLVRVLLDKEYLAAGGHRIHWDGRNEAGNGVADPPFIITLIVDEVSGKEIVIRGDSSQTVEMAGTLPDPSNFYLSGEFRFVCFTYANPDLNLESLPSLVSKERIYFWHSPDEDPPDLRITATPDTTGMPDWATIINIYISDDPISYITEPPVVGTDRRENLKAIETGYDFFKIGELEISEGVASQVISEYEGVVDRGLVLDSYEHDSPVDGFHVIGAYGVGAWGAARNRVYFNKIGNNGEQRLYALPSENALVPHSFPLARSGQSPILHIHPAAHESALLVFKRDALHIIRGKGVITGLYDPQTPVEVDIDASGVIVGTGTMSPRSVVTVGSAVYFVGSDNRLYEYGTDWRGRTDIRDVGLPIQKYLNALSVEQLENLVAFLYQNCYHLITPDRIIILDMTRKYWASAMIRLKDAFWSRGGINSESILYGVTQDDELISLFTGNTDDGEPIGGLWKSNPVLIPSESSVAGLLVVHTTKPEPTVKCRVDIDDVEGEEEEFEPAAWNDFRCGMYGYGSRIQVQVQSDDGFPLLDRIQVEVFPVR